MIPPAACLRPWRVWTELRRRRALALTGNRQQAIDKLPKRVGKSTVIIRIGSSQVAYLLVRPNMFPGQERKYCFRLSKV